MTINRLSSVSWSVIQQLNHVGRKYWHRCVVIRCRNALWQGACHDLLYFECVARGDWCKAPVFRFWLRATEFDRWLHVTVVVEQLRVQKACPVPATALCNSVDREQISVNVGALRRASAQKMRFLLKKKKQNKDERIPAAYLSFWALICVFLLNVWKARCIALAGSFCK